jgi:hypothetical protein
MIYKVWKAAVLCNMQIYILTLFYAARPQIKCQGQEGARWAVNSKVGRTSDPMSVNKTARFIYWHLKFGWYLLLGLSGDTCVLPTLGNRPRSCLEKQTSLAAERIRSQTTQGQIRSITIFSLTSASSKYVADKKLSISLHTSCTGCPITGQ